MLRRTNTYAIRLAIECGGQVKAELLPAAEAGLVEVLGGIKTKDFFGDLPRKAREGDGDYRLRIIRLSSGGTSVSENFLCSSGS